MSRWKKGESDETKITAQKIYEDENFLSWQLMTTHFSGNFPCVSFEGEADLKINVLLMNGSRMLALVSWDFVGFNFIWSLKHESFQASFYLSTETFFIEYLQLNSLHRLRPVGNIRS